MRTKFIAAVFLILLFATQSISQELEVFKKRREALLKKIGKAVAVLYSDSKEEELKGKGIDKDFYYLTGITEPGAILVLAPNERKRKEILFLTSRDPESERWTGERLPLGEELRTRTGFKYVYRTGALGGTLNSILSHTDTLCLITRPVSFNQDIPKEQELYNKLQARWMRKTVKEGTKWITEMRQGKEPLELDHMKKAIAITRAGLFEVFKRVKPEMKESEVQVILETKFREEGALYNAFPSIIATGHNTTILHYTKNDGVIKDGDLLLLDVGAEYNYYASDVTRTIPVSGKFSPEQKKIYEIVLKAQNEALKKVKPGAYIEDINETAHKFIEEAGYGDYFIHGTSHFIGLDVHDVGHYDKPLVPGSVISVEPGIYIPEKDIGVRIEDDVLVTESGYELLTKDIPRDPEEIEKLLFYLKESPTELKKK